jgi:hypothetical protein
MLQLTNPQPDKITGETKPQNKEQRQNRKEVSNN